MNADTAVGLAIEVAEEGLAAGEMPIGAMVIGDDQVLGRAHTAEYGLGRRTVHADLLALLQADETPVSSAVSRAAAASSDTPGST